MFLRFVYLCFTYTLFLGFFMARFILFTTVFCFSTLSFADDHWPKYDPNYRDGVCSYAYDVDCKSKEDNTAELIILGSIAGVIAVGVYYLLEQNDDDYGITARRLTDYQNGKGMRVSSFDSNFDISLFKPINYKLNDQALYITNPIEARKYTFNLINLSFHW